MEMDHQRTDLFDVPGARRPSCWPARAMASEPGERVKTVNCAFGRVAPIGRCRHPSETYYRRPVTWCPALVTRTALVDVRNAVGIDVAFLLRADPPEVLIA